jgi:hypothetical protein
MVVQGRHWPPSGVSTAPTVDGDALADEVLAAVQTATSAPPSRTPPSGCGS